MAGIIEDDLTRRWSLAPEDAAKALRACGTQHYLRWAFQGSRHRTDAGFTLSPSYSAH